MKRIIGLAFATAIAAPAAFAEITRYDGGVIQSYDPVTEEVTLANGKTFEVPSGSTVTESDVGSYATILFRDDGESAWQLYEIEVES